MVKNKAPRNEGICKKEKLKTIEKKCFKNKQTATNQMKF